MNDIDWRRMPALTTLRAFEATARMQGYSAAARTLNVTPAAIAQQVRKLEAEVGASLVQRKGRGLVLTDTGDQLARSLREAFSLIASGIADVRRQQEHRGIRVSTTHYFVDSVILPNLRDFWARYPKVQASFIPDGNQSPLDFQSFDLAIRGNTEVPTWTAYETVHLLDTPLIICAAPSLLEGRGSDLASLPWVAEHGFQEKELREYARRAGFDPGKIKIIDPGDAKFEVDAAIMGYGLCFTTEIVVRKHLKEGSLVWVSTPSIGNASYYAVHGKGPLSASAEVFIEWLKELCSTLSYQGS
jgi:LysR family transcriptional regulator, glycine cleavage system transcriptional activator